VEDDNNDVDNDDDEFEDDDNDVEDDDDDNENVEKMKTMRMLKTMKTLKTRYDDSLLDTSSGKKLDGMFPECHIMQQIKIFLGGKYQLCKRCDTCLMVLVRATGGSC
jgi:hypothetical protein